MVISTDPPFDLTELDTDGAFQKVYEDAVVYADREAENVLHEGAVRLLGNGWVELPSGRLLSPGAVHHIDHVPDVDG